MKTDDTKYKKFSEQVKELDGAAVALGAVGEHEGGLTNSDLFLIHEFGAVISNGFGKGIKIRIPARAPLRRTFENKDVLKGIADRTNKLVRMNYRDDKGFDFDKILNGLGADMVGSLKETIMKGETVPLATRTVEARTAKGAISNVPLVATGQMLNSLQYEVRR